MLARKASLFELITTVNYIKQIETYEPRTLKIWVLFQSVPGLILYETASLVNLLYLTMRQRDRSYKSSRLFLTIVFQGL